MIKLSGGDKPKDNIALRSPSKMSPALLFSTDFAILEAVNTTLLLSTEGRHLCQDRAAFSFVRPRLVDFFHCTVPLAEGSAMNHADGPVGGINKMTCAPPLFFRLSLMPAVNDLRLVLSGCFNIAEMKA